VIECQCLHNILNVFRIKSITVVIAIVTIRIRLINNKIAKFKYFG